MHMRQVPDFLETNPVWAQHQPYNFEELSIGQVQRSLLGQRSRSGSKVLEQAMCGQVVQEGGARSLHKANEATRSQQTPKKAGQEVFICLLSKKAGQEGTQKVCRHPRRQDKKPTKGKEAMSSPRRHMQTFLPSWVSAKKAEGTQEVDRCRHIRRQDKKSSCAFCPRSHNKKAM